MATTTASRTEVAVNLKQYNKPQKITNKKSNNKNNNSIITSSPPPTTTTCLK